MKIAIHDNTGDFTIKWIQYCANNNIEYKLVCAYDSDIISQLTDCDAFMWHFHHADYRDMQMAKPLLISLSTAGKRVFPNPDTCWYFDNKVAEKYLLESVNAPLVKSYVFYTKKDALTWINQTSFPKVFKLKGGAGATNVKLVKDKKDAISLVNKCFSTGFPVYPRGIMLKEAWIQFRKKKLSFKGLMYFVLKGLKRFPTDYARYTGNAKGYAYFQDFIPDNKYDIRLCVVGDKAFGEKRFCRENDFRASGSGSFEYCEIDKETLSVAFETARKLKLQSVAFDFVYLEGHPLIVEMSYAFGTKGICHAPGYYDSDLNWHEGSGFDFCGWMIENILS